MGEADDSPSSSSLPVNSWTGPTAEEVSREIPHLKIQFLANTKYREKCENMKMQISRNPKKRVNIWAANWRGSAAGNRPSFPPHLPSLSSHYTLFHANQPNVKTCPMKRGKTILIPHKTYLSG